MNVSRRKPLWQRHPDLAIALGLAAVALALMSPYILQPKVLAWPRSGLETDLLHYHWSHIHHLRQSLRDDGQLPLWHRTAMGGEPMIGNPSVILAYPPQMMMALLPVPILPGIAFLTALHLWIAGMGSYTLLRAAIGTRRLAALVAALATLLAPRLSSNAVGDIGLDYAMCWVPFCLAWAKLALDRPGIGLGQSSASPGRRRLSWAILAGMGLAFQFLIHVHIFFYTAWTIGLYLGYQAIVAPRQGGWREMGRRWLVQAGYVALMALVCTGLVAFELLPFATFLPALSRESMTLAEANYYALPPTMLLTVAMPSPLKFPEWELYVGLLPLVLLPLSMRHRRRTETAFWVGLAVFAVLFALGTTTPLFSFLFAFVPGFSWLRVPARMWFLAAVAATTLAGLAVDALAERSLRERWGRRWQNWLFLGGWTLALTTVLGRYVMRRPGQLDWLLGFVGTLGLALGVGGATLWIRRRIGYRLFGALLASALLLDLLPVDAAYRRPLSVKDAFEMPAVGQSLLDLRERALEPFRIYSVRGEIPQHVAVKEDLEHIEGMNSFQLASYVALIKQASGCDLPGFTAVVPPCVANEVSATAYREAVPNPALLGLLNVRYVVAPLPLEGPAWALRDTAAGEYLYENLLVQPRAFAVGNVELVDDEETLWRRLLQVDVSRVALVSAKDAPPGPWPTSQEPFHVPARVIEHLPNRIVVDVAVPDAGLLVLGEVWTPGWQATVNGAPAEVLRVDGALRGVRLPAGAQRVVLRFVPRALTWGLGISALTTVVCTIAFILDRCARP